MYLRKWSRRRYSDPRYRAKRAFYLDRPEVRAVSRARTRSYYRRNRAKVLARSRAAYATPEGRQKAIERARRRYATPEGRAKVIARAKRNRWSLRGSFTSYKNAAKIRGHVFRIPLYLFRILRSLPCFYCGVESAGMGLDRFDNSKGYILGNVVACCAPCNRMKHAYTAMFFVEQCRKVVRNLRGHF